MASDNGLIQFSSDSTKRTCIDTMKCKYHWIVNRRLSLFLKGFATTARSVESESPWATLAQYIRSYPPSDTTMYSQRVSR